MRGDIMNPVIIIICLLVIAFIAFFIAYSEEKKSAKNSNSSKDLVDSPQVLFDDSFHDDENDDIEII